MAESDDLLRDNLQAKSPQEQAAGDLFQIDFTHGRKADVMLRVQLQAEAATARLKKVSAPSKQLKLWHDAERVMPTVLARSALFAPLANGERKRHVDALIDGRSDAVLRYSGPQLDMGDADVFMQVLELGKRLPLGTRFSANRAQMLRAIGRSYSSTSADGKQRNSSIGTTQYQWLDEAMARLRAGVLTVEFNETPNRRGHGHGGTVSLVHTWRWDDQTDSYLVALEPGIEILFSVFSRIYVEKHLALPKRDQLAKWMHLYIAGCTQNVQTNIGLRYLRLWSGNKDRRLDHFEKAMKRALGELADAGIVGPGFYIRGKDQMVCFERIF